MKHFLTNGNAQTKSMHHRIFKRESQTTYMLAFKVFIAVFKKGG